MVSEFVRTRLSLVFVLWILRLNRQHGRDRFATMPPVIDRTDGFVALRLYRERDGNSSICAEVVYWDACGQFYLETKQGDVPLDVIEEMIAEARQLIKFR